MKSTALSEPGQEAALAMPLPDLADKINAEHRACESAMNAGLQHAIEAGRLLLEAKEQCLHGTWLPWVRNNCEFSKRTAQAYIRLARECPKLAAKAQRVAHLSFREAIVATANNVQIVSGQPAKERDATLKVWDKEQCQNARRAAARAEVHRSTRPPRLPAEPIREPEYIGPMLCGRCRRPVEDGQSEYCRRWAEDMLAWENRDSGAGPVPADDVLDDSGDVLDHADADISPEKRAKTKAIRFGNEAVDALRRIPKNDPLRKRGFQIVTDWIRTNANGAVADAPVDLREVFVAVRGLVADLRLRAPAEVLADLPRVLRDVADEIQIESAVTTDARNTEDTADGK